MAQSKVRKKNKKFNFKNPVLIVFLLAIIGLGVFIIFRGFASDGLLGASKILVAKVGDHLGVGDGELIQVRPTLPFALYDNGLAVCGNYSDSDKKHNLPYYSKTLTPQERDSFVASLVATGFMDLKQNYPETISRYDSISVASSGVANAVNVQHGYTGIDAAAYTKSDAIITSFCSSLNTAYEPEEVAVMTKIVSPSMGKKGESALDPEISVPTDNAIKTQNIKGATAKKLYKTHGKKGEKFSYNASGVIQTMVIPVLPAGVPIASTKNLPPKTSQNTLSPVVATANAARNPPLPTKFYRFCPKDMALICIPNTGPSVQDMIDRVNPWYAIKLGVVFDIKDMGLLRGLQDNVWYKSYHPVVAITTNDPDYKPGATPDVYVIPNIYHELYIVKGWALDAPRIMNYQGTIGKRDWCGMAYVPTLKEVQAGKGTLGIVTTDPPSLGGDCSSGDGLPWGFFDAATAHELAHTQGLGHTALSNKAPELMSNTLGCGSLSNCGIDPLQRTLLRAFSPFVKQVK